MKMANKKQPTDGVWTEIKDEGSDTIPSVAEMRESQKKGAEGRGLPENSTDKLNECQGHEVDIRE